MQVAALSGGWQEQARCRAHVLCGENWMGTCWVGTPTGSAALWGWQAGSAWSGLWRVTLSMQAPPPPPNKHPWSFEGTAQGFLRGLGLLNERAD